MSNLSRSKVFQAAPLVLYVFALAMAILAIISGVEEMSSSVPGGSAVLLIAFIMLALVGWRISFRWKQLHDQGR